MDLTELITRVNEETSKNHTLAFDIWAHTQKISDKELHTASSLQEKISAYPDSPTFRVRMYWVYGHSKPRFLKEYLITNMPVQQTPAMGNVHQPAQAFAQEEFEDDEDDTVPLKASKSMSLRLDGKNPLSWMLHEKISQLERLETKYAAVKQEKEKLRDDKERLERELIKKDHEIEMLNSEAETASSGLSGILGGPTNAQTAIQVMGPDFMKLFGKLLGIDNSGPPQATGVLADITDWLQTLDADDQARVREIMVVIATKHRAQPEWLEALRMQMDKLRQQMETDGTIITKAS